MIASHYMLSEMACIWLKDCEIEKKRTSIATRRLQALEKLDEAALEYLEDYLIDVETELKKDLQAPPFRFLDLPPELRVLVYEQVAYDTTISIDKVAIWRQWPGICFASHQVYDESLKIDYRYAAFEATVRHLDYSRIINFINNQPHTSLGALSANERLTIILDDVCQIRHVTNLGPLLQPWFHTCRSLAAKGTDIRWNYAAADLDAPYRGRLSQFAPRMLRHCGYTKLRRFYYSLEDERMKDEITAVLLALRNAVESRARLEAFNLGFVMLPSG